MKKLVIFGSGTGGNAVNICHYFKNSSDIEVVLICTNNKDAFIVDRAKKLNIPLVFTSKTGLLKFDDLAKVEGKKIPNIEHFRKYVEKSLI